MSQYDSLFLISLALQSISKSSFNENLCSPHIWYRCPISTSFKNQTNFSSFGSLNGKQDFICDQYLSMNPFLNFSITGNSTFICASQTAEFISSFDSIVLYRSPKKSLVHFRVVFLQTFLRIPQVLPQFHKSSSCIGKQSAKRYKSNELLRTSAVLPSFHKNQPRRSAYAGRTTAFQSVKKHHQAAAFHKRRKSGHESSYSNG